MSNTGPTTTGPTGIDPATVRSEVRRLPSSQHRSPLVKGGKTVECRGSLLYKQCPQAKFSFFTDEATFSPTNRLFPGCNPLRLRFFAVFPIYLANASTKSVQNFSAASWDCPRRSLKLATSHLYHDARTGATIIKIPLFSVFSTVFSLYLANYRSVFFEILCGHSPSIPLRSRVTGTTNSPFLTVHRHS